MIMNILYFVSLILVIELFTYVILAPSDSPARLLAAPLFRLSFFVLFTVNYVSSITPSSPLYTGGN